MPAVLIVAALFRRAPATAQGPRAAPTVGSTHRRELIGTTSCSASVCHGGSDLGQPLSEAATWRALDPHARAYDTLLSAESQAIARHLWGTKTAAHEAPLCLKCHVDPVYDHARPNFRRQDGVGCESCHGPAQDWLTPHYRATWHKQDKQALGMSDTKSLPGRAAVCVKCHVGTPDANVDHDLIAAGHPALRFEFATYLANLPAHWDVAQDKKANSTDPAKVIDFETRAWSIGQLVTSASALELLAHRADPATGKVWPEFAELDCFSCHHDLQGASWRQSKKHLGDRRPGSLAWNEWYYAALSHAMLIRTLSKEPKTFRDFRLDSKPRGDLAKQADVAAKSLRELATRTTQEAFHADQLPWLLTLGPSRSWDDAAQRYLAHLSLRQMRKDNEQPDDADLERLIGTLRDDVPFPSDFNSPRRFVPPALRR